MRHSVRALPLRQPARWLPALAATLGLMLGVSACSDGELDSSPPSSASYARPASPSSACPPAPRHLAAVLRKAVRRTGELQRLFALHSRGASPRWSARSLRETPGRASLLPSQRELLRAIADRLLEPLRDLEATDDWRETCRRFAGALRGIAKARPASFRLVGLEPFDTAESLQPVERFLGALVAAGFAVPEALGIYRAVVSYARGYALAEASGFTVDAANAKARERLRTLDRRSFPILAGRTRQLAQLDADSAYEFGLSALVNGLPNPTDA